MFLFFGLFREIIETAGRFVWNTRSSVRHVVWGWLQIGEALKVDDCDRSRYDWAKYHPHFHRDPDANNTLYIARRYLRLPGVSSKKRAGAGVFTHLSEELVLTAPAARTPTQWELPQWFYPRDGLSPLTYHSDLGRWKRTRNRTRLSAVARGQEFVLDTAKFPDAIEWIEELLAAS